MTDFNKVFGIQAKEGETLDDAILRLSAEVTPASQSPEDKPAKKKKEPKVTVTDPGTGDEAAGHIFSAVHVYRRRTPDGQDEPEGQVRVNGTREREMHGPNVLVFVHMHIYGEPCSPACRERVSK